jgi:heme/copper-type cytochrome/quinol oxidase subunit 2
MEVCGRYHHWMPILVRVVHRDVFLSWCLVYLGGLRPSTLAGAEVGASTPVALA